MKRIIKFALVAAVFLMGTASAYSQDKLMFKVGYSPGFPVGSFKEFMGKNSFRGYMGEIAYPVTEQFRLGLGVSYNDFYEKHPRQVYELNEGTVSAVVSNSIQTTPIMIKAAYDLTKTGWIRPYVGIGGGFNLVSYAQYFGEFGEKQTKFKPAAAAEAGITIPFNRETRGSGINLGAHFNYLPFKVGTVDHLNNWGVHAAVYFPLR
jgi:opacity protein-like surface antigen